MTHRPYIDKTNPDIYKSLYATARLVRTAILDAGLTVAHLELANVCASQINGCVTCLSIHTKAARRAGVEERKLDILPAWRESSVFTPTERAVLQLTELATEVSPRNHYDAELREINQVLSTEQIAAVEWAAVLINAFNRVSIMSGHPAL